MLISEQLQQLQNTVYDEPKKVFSLYLNMDPENPDEKGQKWKIKLKKALQSLEKETTDSDSHEEKNQSKTIRQKIEKEIYGKEDQLKRSLILFATADEDLWFSYALNLPVTTESHWTNRPEVAQLQTLLSDYPHTGILVMQQDQARVIETEVGRLLDTTHYELNISNDQWREHSGPQGSDLTQGGSQKDEYQEHKEAHQQRWFKNLAAKIEKKAKDQGWEQIWLVGEKDEINPLQGYFNKKINKTVPKNVLHWSNDSILITALED